MLAVLGLWPCWPSCGWQHPICGWHEHFYLGLGLHIFILTPSSYPRAMEFLPILSRPLLPDGSVAAAPAGSDLQAHPLTRGHRSLIHLPVRPCKSPPLGLSFLCHGATTALCSYANPHSMCLPATHHRPWLATALGSLRGWELCFPFLPGPIHRDLSELRCRLEKRKQCSWGVCGLMGAEALSPHLVEETAGF